MCGGVGRVWILDHMILVVVVHDKCYQVTQCKQDNLFYETHGFRVRVRGEAEFRAGTRTEAGVRLRVRE